MKSKRQNEKSIFCISEDERNAWNEIKNHLKSSAEYLSTDKRFIDRENQKKNQIKCFGPDDYYLFKYDVRWVFG